MTKPFSKQDRNAGGIRHLSLFLFVAGLFWLTGCTGYRPLSDPVLKTKLLTNPVLADRAPGKDIRTGKQGAVVAFNIFFHADPTSSNQGKTGRQQVTVPELRNLTDAMLHSFLANLQTVPALDLLPNQRMPANRPYLRLPGHLGAQLAPLPLNRRQGILAAPYNLKYLHLAGSAGHRAFRKEVTRGDAFAWLKGVLGKSEILVGPEDLSLLSQFLQVDFVIAVNNQVRFAKSPAGTWEAHLELVEVCIAGPDNLKHLAYARHVKGDFINRQTPLRSDKVEAKIWQVMQYQALSTDPHAPESPADRDFAESPFWPQMAPPYRRICRLFTKDLSQIRQAQQ